MPTPSSSPVRSWPPSLSELPSSQALFELGRCRLTQAAADVLAKHSIDPSLLLLAHTRGAWQPSAGSIGTTTDLDVQSNLDALVNGARIIGFFSAGGDGSVDDDERVWVITDAVHPDTGRRWMTTILLPREY